MPSTRIMMAVVAGVSLLIPLAPMAASAPEGRPGPSFQVLSATGSGCSSGSTRIAARDFMLRYTKFVVSGGDYRSCTVSVKAGGAGWTFMIPSVKSRARVKLGAGGTARLMTNMWLTGFPSTMRDDKQIAGPSDNHWGITTTPERPIWAPCGASVNLSIAQTLRVAGTSSNTARLLTMTLTPPKWKKC